MVVVVASSVPGQTRKTYLAASGLRFSVSPWLNASFAVFTATQFHETQYKKRASGGA